VSKIELSYHLGSENSVPSTADLSKQRQQALLRNALMDLLQAVRVQGSIAAAAKSLGMSISACLGGIKKMGNQAQSKPHRLGKGHAG